MTLAATGAEPGVNRRLGASWLRARAARALDVAMPLWMASGAMVLFDPSPYELGFLLVLPLMVLAGQRLTRSTLPLFFCVIGFIPFAIIGAFQATFTPTTDSLVFVA